MLTCFSIIVCLLVDLASPRDDFSFSCCPLVFGFIPIKRKFSHVNSVFQKQWNQQSSIMRIPVPHLSTYAKYLDKNMVWNELHKDSSQTITFPLFLLCWTKKGNQANFKIWVRIIKRCFHTKNSSRYTYTPYHTIPLLRELPVFIIPSWVSPILIDSLLKISTSSSAFLLAPYHLPLNVSTVFILSIRPLHIPFQPQELNFPL